MGWKAKNIKKPMVFIGFLHFWEARKRCLRHLGGCLGRCWLHDLVFWNVFGHVGDQEGQDGAQEGQHGDQERQDEPT